MDVDWQNNLTAIKDRGQYLLQTEKWADCRFLVGTAPNHRIIAGHKLLLAMGSPVFERMFFGNLPDKTDPIVIPDVQPEAFEAMMEYIYTDRITIGSFDKACELCYVAKKYMLPHVVTRCTHFLWADLSPKNACRAYEFAKLFDEPRIMQSSMDLISTNTREVLSDPSFMDIEVSTLMAILDQNRLNIDSELDLFNCLLKFANERGILNESGQPEGLYMSGDKEVTTKQSPDHSSGDIMVEEIKMEPDVAAMVQHMHQDDDGDSFEADPNGPSTSSAAAAAAATASPDADANGDADADAAASDDVVIIESDASGNALDDEVNMINIMDAQRTIMDGAMLRQAVKKIRFLTMTPQQFAEGPARSKLLQQHEALAILIKISSPTLNDCNMPEGFCISRSTRNFYEPAHRQRELAASYRHTGATAAATATFFPVFGNRNNGGEVLFSRMGATIHRTNNRADAPAPPINAGIFGEEGIMPLGLRAPETVSVADNPGANPASHATLRCFGDGYEGGGAAPVGPNNANDNEPPAVGGVAGGGAGAGAGAGGVGIGGESGGNQHNDMVRAYCTRSLTRQFDYRNTSVTDAGVTFQVDTNIWILGVQVPTRVLCGELMTSAGFTERYNEVLYAHIQDMHGSRITYTHCTARVRYDSLLDITFDRPVYIYRNQIYKIYVVFNKAGWYPMYSCVPDANSHRVKFMFNVGNPTESVRDGLIYAIIFFTPQDHARHLID
ncbi:uncharacterized protein LOC117581603 isoform X1 [Drosophila guanche]|uniref:Blast:BTB/POZ domain-containing protein 3 n=1 Tax=Drosophila guanche TaxID=7266 RepID=A0A3B0JE96_DROGU|nr:uncharacterized protein LOC117581603 isoform X1 [Drosophila guanche]SPP78492.1 blast:BTB/POZ domain-containing protein 3 [Drosophila guanche]